MSTPDTSFTPLGVLDDNNNYVLQTKDVYSLLKYVWTGVLIATTPAEYQTRVGVTADAYATVCITPS
jgi:hypothetical protein